MLNGYLDLLAFLENVSISMKKKEEKGLRDNYLRIEM